MTNTRKPQWLLPLLIGLALGPGCSKKDGPDCAKVSTHFIALLRTELAKQGSSEQSTAAQANLPTLQNALLEACEKEKWTEATRICLVEAKVAADTEACDPALMPTEDKSAELPQPAQTR